jgi:hypothetical protein
MLYTQLSRTYHALYLILHTNYPSVRPTPHLYSSFFYSPTPLPLLSITLRQLPLSSSACVSKSTVDLSRGSQRPSGGAAPSLLGQASHHLPLTVAQWRLPDMTRESPCTVQDEADTTDLLAASDVSRELPGFRVAARAQILPYFPPQRWAPPL